MLRGTAMSEIVCEQALSPVECDIPAGQSIDEYRRCRPMPPPERPSLFQRLLALPRSPAAAGARSDAR